jgi:hypothetical protein
MRQIFLTVPLIPGVLGTHNIKKLPTKGKKLNIL